MKTKLFILSFAGAFLSACGTQIPLEAQRPENNQTYEVKYLFEHDGVRVYRFLDRGNDVYFTSPGTVVTAIDNDSTGRRNVTIIGQE